MPVSLFMVKPDDGPQDADVAERFTALKKEVLGYVKAHVTPPDSGKASVFDKSALLEGVPIGVVKSEEDALRLIARLGKEFDNVTFSHTPYALPDGTELRWS